MLPILGYRRRVFLLTCLAAVWALLAASDAQASTVTVGSPLTGPFTGSTFGSHTSANTALGEPGANVTSPVTGVLILWRITGTNTSGGPFKLRVLRPAGGGAYTGAGTSAPGTLSGTGTHTFTTNLPIQAGDLIGIDSAMGSNVGTAGVSGSTESLWTPPLADGSTAAPPSNGANEEIGFNADVQPRPGVTALSPTGGPTAGGTTVTISGHDFSGATTVSFGGVAAAIFPVTSDNQITAVSPPASAPGPVDVRVTTVAGTTPAVAGDRFTYTASHTACVVPNLRKKKLKAARKALNNANCSLGKVRKRKGSKKGKVKKQSAKPGTVLPPGSKVNVKLG